MSEVLGVDGISVRYGPMTALHEVSMSVQAGSLTTVIGLNGAGKTTLLRSICGLVDLAAGSVRYRGATLHRRERTPHRLAQQGLLHVPQSRGVLASLTVHENLQIAAEATHGEQGRISDVYERFPLLQSRRNQRAGQLSGGEQQILALGRCLLVDATVLLLDEPSIGLAPKIVVEVFDMIDELVSGGAAVLLVEQNVRLALARADRGYLLDRGRVVLEGAAQSLAADPLLAEVFLGGGSARRRGIDPLSNPLATSGMPANASSPRDTQGDTT